MRILFITALLLLSSGCAPLVVGVAAGLAISEHERHRDWCMQYYGNPHCYKDGWPTAYTYMMPR